MKELRTTLPYFRPYLGGFLVGVALVVVTNVFSIVTPYLMKLAIDGLQDPDMTLRHIGLLAGAIVVATFLGGAARFGMRQFLNSISRKMEADLRNDFFRHLLRLDASFYGSVRTGDLMSRATNDTLAVRQAVGPAVMYTVNTAVGFTFALALMLYISPKLTLYAMIPMALLPPMVLGFGRVIHRRFTEIQEQFSTLSTMVQENLTGVRIVRAYVQEREQARRFDELNQEYRQRNMRLIYASGAFRPLMQTIAGVAMVVVLWLGGLEVMAGTITVGDFVAFGFYLMLLVWPMIALGWVVNLFQRGEASMGRLNKILHTEPALAVPDEPRSLASARGKVEFRDVSFRYPGTERAVLRGVSFVAEPGRTVALVGPTGSGKSTLMALLCRLYDATEGQVLVDDVPVTDVDPGELRRAIGVVPQDAFLFSDTIEANIALGLEAGGRASSGDRVADGEPDGRDADERDERSPDVADAVETAARIAKLHEQIQEFPHGYDTELGERGINLSGGQKQRATLARAVARDPAVLILDDALSAVDTHTETAILADLRSVMAGRTSFIISHRVSAVMHADHILVLEDGEIVERGTHDELLAHQGTYERLLRRQLLEESLEEGEEEEEQLAEATP
jgi:ATP-binding cassette subfamily B protein